MTVTKSETAKKAGTNTKPASVAKASDAGAPPKGDKGLVVATGHAFQSARGRLEEGAPITKEDLKTARDPSGETEFKRQWEKGAIVKASKSEAIDPDLLTAATITTPTGAGAGPSAAQIIAADTGNDPAAEKVVDAALSGSETALEAAADPGAGADAKGG